MNNYMGYGKLLFNKGILTLGIKKMKSSHSASCEATKMKIITANFEITILTFFSVCRLHLGLHRA